MASLASASLLLTVALLLSAPQAARADGPDDWASFRHDPAGTGYNPGETLLRPPLRLNWSYPTVGEVVMPPVASGGIVYAVAGDGRIYAIDASTGVLSSNYWGTTFFGLSPSVDHGTGYASGDDGRFYALDPATWQVKWSYSTGAVIRHSPVVSGGVVYGGLGNTVIALDAADGALKWSLSSGYPLGSVLAVDDGVVYVSLVGYVQARDAATGSLKWERTLGYSDSRSVAVAGGMIYLSTYSFGYHIDEADILALDAQNGEIRWSFSNSGWVTRAFAYSSPAVANGVIYFGSEDFRVYALDSGTGSVKWVTMTGGPVRSSPAVANGVVYAGSDDGKVYGLDAGTGAIRWEYDTGAPVGSSPAVAGGMLFIGSNSGVYAFENEEAPAIPNLSVAKIVSRDQAYPGDALSYLVYLDNRGSESTSVAVTDTIPAGLSYITDTVSIGAVFSPTLNSVLWSGAVPPGGSSLPSVALGLRARLDENVRMSSITNTVLVSNGGITVTASAGTEIWRRQAFLPGLFRGSAGW